jgi:hypothetical protein
VLFDCLVAGQVVETDPCSFRAWSEARRENRQDNDSDEWTGPPASGQHRLLRDRALISIMTLAFARVSAIVTMRVEDYYPKGKRWWVRLHEQGGKRHEMPAHQNLEACLDAL